MPNAKYTDAKQVKERLAELVKQGRLSQVDSDRLLKYPAIDDPFLILDKYTKEGKEIVRLQVRGFLPFEAILTPED